jgi:hypothetical protein
MPLLRIECVVYSAEPRPREDVDIRAGDLFTPSRPTRQAGARMTKHASDLNLLMVHADDHAPVLAEGLAESTAQGQKAGEATSSAGHFWDEGGDPNDLEAQRWGVIAPQGPEGDRLLALVAPLLAHRQEQQGDAIKVYRVPPGLSQDEAMRWKKREFETGADLNIEVPRYQLILGDLDKVSLGLQQVHYI